MRYSPALAAAITLGLCTGAYAQSNVEPAQKNYTGQTAPSGTDKPAETKEGQKMSPGSVGAMENVTGGTATSAEDVRRQTQGKPTMRQEAQQRSNATDKKPDPTEYTAGSVGAAPGTNPPATDHPKQK
jgi:hypothetical protein